MSESVDQTVTYAIRVFERARRDIEEAATRLADLQGDAIALRWLDGIENEIAKLATNPRRFPIVAEASGFPRETRQMLFKRSASSVAYRVIFFVVDQNTEDAVEPPGVFVIHVRHASRKAITSREARVLRRER